MNNAQGTNFDLGVEGRRLKVDDSSVNSASKGAIKQKQGTAILNSFYFDGLATLSKCGFQPRPFINCLCPAICTASSLCTPQKPHHIPTPTLQ